MSYLENTPSQDYEKLQEAYNWFNERLFENRLPQIVFVFRGGNSSYGHFLHTAFGRRDGKGVYDRLAVNPVFFDRPDIEILSTLVHEMTHVEEELNGTASPGSYHNKMWVKLMQRVGLEPFNVGDPSKQTGTTVSHRIVAGGQFEAVANELLAQGWTVHLIEFDAYAGRVSTPELDKLRDRAAQKRKTTYVCGCGNRVWGKSGLVITCGECGFDYDEQ